MDRIKNDEKKRRKMQEYWKQKDKVEGGG